MEDDRDHRNQRGKLARKAMPAAAMNHNDKDLSDYRGDC